MVGVPYIFMNWSELVYISMIWSGNMSDRKKNVRGEDHPGKDVELHTLGTMDEIVTKSAPRPLMASMIRLGKTMRVVSMCLMLPQIQVLREMKTYLKNRF